MKKAKKRAVSFILTIALAMATFLAVPMSAFAQTPDITGPTVSDITPTTAYLGFTTDIEARNYWALLEGPPDQTLIAAGGAAFVTGFPPADWVNYGSGTNAGMGSTHNDLTPGTVYTFYVVSVDTEDPGTGDVSAVAYITFTTLDVLLTQVSVSRTSETAATVQFSSTFPGWYAYQLDGAAPDPTTLAWTSTTTMALGTNTITLTGLSPGTHTIYIAGIEEIDNENGVVSNLLTITIPAFDTGGGTQDGGTQSPGAARPDVPQTGDSSNAAGWSLALIGSLLGLCTLTVLRRRFKSDDAR